MLCKKTWLTFCTCLENLLYFLTTSIIHRASIYLCESTLNKRLRENVMSFCSSWHRGRVSKRKRFFYLLLFISHYWEKDLQTFILSHGHLQSPWQELVGLVNHPVYTAILFPRSDRSHFWPVGLAQMRKNMS